MVRATIPVGRSLVLCFMPNSSWAYEGDRNAPACTPSLQTGRRVRGFFREQKVTFESILKENVVCSYFSVGDSLQPVGLLLWLSSRMVVVSTYASSVTGIHLSVACC